MAVGGVTQERTEGNEKLLLTDSEYKEYNGWWLQRLCASINIDKGGHINRLEELLLLKKCAGGCGCVCRTFRQDKKG